MKQGETTNLVFKWSHSIDWTNAVDATWCGKWSLIRYNFQQEKNCPHQSWGQLSSKIRFKMLRTAEALPNAKPWLCVHNRAGSRIRWVYALYVAGLQFWDSVFSYTGDLRCFLVKSLHSLTPIVIQGVGQWTFGPSKSKSTSKNVLKKHHECGMRNAS